MEDAPASSLLAIIPTHFRDLSRQGRLQVSLTRLTPVPSGCIDADEVVRLRRESLELRQKCADLLSENADLRGENA